MKRFPLILSSFIAVLLLAFFTYTLAVGRIPSVHWQFWPNSKNTTPTTNTAAQSSLAFTQTPISDIPGRMYVFRNHQLLSYEPVTKQTEIISTFSDDVTTVAISPNLDTYAYLATKDQKDTLKLRRRGETKDITLITADHSFTGEQEIKLSAFLAPIRFSPDGRYLLVRQTFWESCGDVLVNVETAKVVTTLNCESALWSNDGKTVAIGNGQSYDGPSILAVGSPAKLPNLPSVAWSTLKGDGADFLDAQQQSLWAHVTPAVAEDGTIIFLVAWTEQSPGVHQGSALYRYSPSDNSIHRLVTFPAYLSGTLVVIGNQALIISAEGQYLVDLEGKTSRLISGGIGDVGRAFVQFFRSSGTYVLMATTDEESDGSVTTSQLTLINLGDHSAARVFDATDAQFAGWSPLIPPSRDLEYLQQVYHITALPPTKIRSLNAQIENWSLYKPDPNVELGSLDCGASAKHDQLQSLNNATKKSLMLNDGLTVTITPNLYHWNAVEMTDFIEDDTVVCGVATTIPHVVAGDYLLWWNHCLGGAGIGQPGTPYFDQSIRCVQAEDVLQRHFSMQ